MHAALSILEQSVWPYISTGHLPRSEMVRRLVSEAHARFRSHTEGPNSRVYPALARMPRDLFGICVATLADDGVNPITKQPRRSASGRMQ
jgi:hypothetical protein